MGSSRKRKIGKQTESLGGQESRSPSESTERKEINPKQKGRPKKTADQQTEQKDPEKEEVTQKAAGKKNPRRKEPTKETTEEQPDLETEVGKQKRLKVSQPLAMQSNVDNGAVMDASDGQAASGGAGGNGAVDATAVVSLVKERVREAIAAAIADLPKDTVQQALAEVLADFRVLGGRCAESAVGAQHAALVRAARLGCAA
jgi:hypothetical protein